MQSVPLGGFRMTEALAPHFTEVVDILACTQARNTIGEVVSSWAVRVGMDSVPAAIGAVDVGLRIRPQETRKDEVTQVREQRRFMLRGYYPTLAHTDRMRWEGDDWNIVALLHDPSRTFTAGLIERVEPGDV